jgi:hypothetical protein
MMHKPKRYMLTCAACGRKIEVARKALTCSPACRVALHRYPELKERAQLVKLAGVPLEAQQRALPEMHGLVAKRNAVQRMKALHHVWERLPSDVYEVLRDKLRIVGWLIPDSQEDGSVMPASEFKSKQMREIIYIAPHLEDLPFEEVVETVAHELVHVYLEHLHKRPPGQTYGEYYAAYNRDEREVDRSVEEWGFKAASHV